MPPLHRLQSRQPHWLPPPADPRALLVGPSPECAYRMASIVRDAAEAWSLDAVEDLEGGMVRLEGTRYDVALLDLPTATRDGAGAIAQLKASAPDLPVLVLCDTDHEHLGARAVRSGALDYLVRERHDSIATRRALRYALQRSRTLFQLKRLAHYDTLTSVANRELFRTWLARRWIRARRTGQRLAILFVDLDRFKYVNDTLGHAAGDQLLVEVARRIARQLRGYDQVARLGGDEFAVLIDTVGTPDEAVGVAQRVLASLEAPVQLGPTDIYIGASVGIAIGGPGDGDWHDLLARADQAMYEAKRRGRNRWCVYTEAVGRQAIERATWESELRLALRERAFDLHYQPIVDLRTRSVLGVEALLRWRRRNGEEVQPSRFIPSLEVNRQIVEVGAWALETALDAFRKLNAAGCQLDRVAVNVSARQLETGDLASVVADLLTRSGVAPKQLELEVTESLLLRPQRGTARTLRELRALGVRVALDDFGTGYSSLSYLNDHPVDAIKIDRSFVRDVTTDPRCAAIVGAVLDLARRLGLDTTAEGVETEAQARFLADEGCRAAQGFLFGRPCAAHALGAPRR